MAQPGSCPRHLWIVLFFIAAIILVFLLGMADSAERPWVPPLFMGSVVAVIAALLLLLRFLDDPVQGGVGGLQPVAMERTLQLIDQQLAVDRRRRGDPLRRNWRADVTAVTTAGEPRRKDWVEIFATALLAVAAVATAWSSYQANRWNGETTKATGRVNALRIEAARAQGLAEAQTEVDIAMFFQWVNATDDRRGRARRLLRRPVPPRLPAGLRCLVGH